MSMVTATANDAPAGGALPRLAERAEAGIDKSLPHVRQLALFIAFAIALAAAFWLFRLATTPGYAPLFAGLADRDAVEVADALRGSNIPYRLDPATGAITVPESQLHEARMRLAAQGLPQGGGRVGIEMIQGDQGFGVSQFVEGARYQHALETELARSIATLRPVRDARVHLAMPKPSAFARSREPAGASVVLDMFPGRTLEHNQVQAIVHMVSSSISELSPERVTVVDQTGRLLTLQDQDSEAALSARQFEQVRRLESAYIERVRQLLEPFVGPGRVSAQVTVDMDFSVSEEARELFNNDPAKLRSEQVAEQVNQRTQPTGVPGATANTPPGPEMEAEMGTASSSRSATRNFELDRTLTHTRQPPGRVRRVTAAILVDHIPGPAVVAEGEPARIELRALDEAELARIEALVREAVGFDANRGDSVSVMNAPFARAEPLEEIPGPPIYEQPWFWTALRWAGGLVGLALLVMLVLRPMLQAIARPARPGRDEEDEDEDEAELRQLASPDGATMGQGEQVRSLPSPPADPHEERIARARAAVAADPKQVAQVVKSWVGSDG